MSGKSTGFGPRDPIREARIKRERARNTERSRSSAVAILQRLDEISGPGSRAERNELLGELAIVSSRSEQEGSVLGGTALSITGEGFIPGSQSGERLLRNSKSPIGSGGRGSKQTLANADFFSGLPNVSPTIGTIQSGGSIDLLKRGGRRTGRRGRSGRPNDINAPTLASNFVVGSGTALGLR